MKILIILFLVAVIVTFVLKRRNENRDPGPSKSPPFGDYPNEKTINEWDDASLFASLGYKSTCTFDSLNEGEELNETDQVLASLFMFDNEICNGGFGQWLYQTPCDLLAATCKSLEIIKADDMLNYVRPIIEESGGSALFDEDTREAHLDSLP